MADFIIPNLPTLNGVDLGASDQLPVYDTSASETKKITVVDLVGNATTLLADATIPGAKILFGSQQIAGSALVNGAVSVSQLANDAVTPAKLADESTVDLVTTLPASGGFIGQIALDIDDSKIYCWNGSTWVSIKAAGSVNSVVGSTSGVVNVVVTTVGDEVTISTTLDNTTAAAQFLAGPTAAAGTVSYRPIAGADLPTATTTTKGAVIVNGNGLTVSGDTIAINNSVAAETSNYHIVQYDSKGLVTGGRVINAGDVPAATASTLGVSRPGTGLGVTAGGVLNHSNVIAPGTGTKLTFDSEGHITASQTLAEADIPDIPATKITTGTLDIARIGTNAVTGSKLANYSVTKIGSTQPTPEYIGQFFFNPLSKDFFVWDGNVFQPIGISAGEIIFAGIYNASTNLLTSVTAEGAAAGFVNGSALPAAALGNNRHYVVVSQAGTGTAPAPTVTLEPPDILLSNGTTYSLVEVSQTVTAQTAVNVPFSPTGSVAATNVQAAIAEVDSEKLAKAGDTMTGQLLIGNAGSLVFEGATDNAFETTLAVADPTADRTITLPDVTGTVVTTGDTGSVTSTMIANGTIVDADVNASAAIAGTKISPDFGSQTVATTGVFSHALGTAAAPTVTFTGDTNTGIYSPGADQLAISTNGTERARIDSSGRLLVGTSTTLGGTAVNIANGSLFLSANDSAASMQLTRASANIGSPSYFFNKARGTFASPTVVSSGDICGSIVLRGYDGSAYVNAATIEAAVDGTPGLNDMPGRIFLSTTLDGASAPTERLRITNDGVIGYNQPAPAAVNATATLTVADLKTGIITSTSAAATDMTLPTGTDTQAGFSGTYDNFTFEWSVINTGPSLVRVLAGTAHTVVGSGSVATGTSGRFASRRTAANTFVTYRLS